MPDSIDEGRWRTRLVSRLTRAFVLPTAAVVAVAALIALLEIRSTVRSAAYDRLVAATAVRQAQFERWADEEANDLDFVIGIPAVRAGITAVAAGDQAAAGPLGRQLQYAVESQRDFTRLAVVDVSDARILAASEASAVGRRHHGADDLLRARAGPLVRTLDSARTGEESRLSVAIPVTQADGRVIAIIVGDANLGHVDELIDEKSGLGGTGEAFLVNRFHEIVRATGDERLPVVRHVRTPAIDRALAGESGAGVYTSYTGREVVGVYRWLPDQQLALFAEMSTVEAFARSRRLAWEMAVFCLLGLGTLIFGLTFVARHIATPILEIADAARRVEQGDLTASAPVRTHDEIGQLATAFNAMTARLRGAQHETEAQFLAREDAAHETEASRRLLRDVIDHLPALIAAKGLDGRYIITNAAFGAMYGLPAESLLGHGPDFMMSPAHTAEIVAADAQVMATGETLVGERVHGGPTGDRTYLTARFPLFDAQGRMFGIGVVATDITERKRLEAQILHQQKLEAVGRLAGGVAHDMNNLLTAVRCNAELILDGLPPEHPDRQPLEEIERSVRNGSALTRQLLTFSRANVVRPSALDINRILGGMAAMLRRYVGTGIDMRFELADDLWLVRADEGQMEQVLLNLLSNAHDAMPGGGTATVVTSNVVVAAIGHAAVVGLTPGDYVKLAVRDTGIGIEAEMIPLLFEPFFTTKEAGRGTGLGLSTAYAIVQQAQGAIVVDSVVGAGTTFTVYLPRHADGVATTPIVIPPPTPSSGGEQLLVVDDDPAVRTALRRMLALEGYRILEAQSGRDALALLDAHGSGVALLLTDVFMPAMGGHELAEQVRARWPSIPVVFMSGYTANEIVRRGLMHANTSFLQKPFNRPHLVQLIAETLGGARVV